jgi:hypothetical protein
MGRKLHDPNKVSFAPEWYLILANVPVMLVTLQGAQTFHFTVLWLGFRNFSAILKATKELAWSFGHLCQSSSPGLYPTSSSLSAQQ